jgi:hypothetical protein
VSTKTGHYPFTISPYSINGEWWRIYVLSGFWDAVGSISRSSEGVADTNEVHIAVPYDPYGCHARYVNGIGLIAYDGNERLGNYPGVYRIDSLRILSYVPH